MSRSRICGIAFAAAFGLVTLFDGARAGETKTGIVELFTSQGCSSCPPADKFAGDLAKRDDILVLSFPVDYWDFLGWKDTLASPEYSQRQRSYARYRRDRNVYTPQMVINGRAHAVGSYRDDVKASLQKTSADFKSRQIGVDLHLDGERINITIDERESGQSVDDATIWLVLYNRAEKVKIGRGENHGRTITYHNVVRELVPIGMWSGESMQISLPKKDLMQKGYDACAVIVQAKGTGPIFGVAALDNWHVN